MSIIDMQAMRYINLLDKTARVKTRKCFVHNNTLFFAVDKRQVSRAIGPGAVNIKKLQESLGKRVKIIQEAEGIKDVQKFIENVVSPVKFKSLDIKEGVIVIMSGNNQSKAALIGRDKRRFDELSKIVKDFFGMDLKIV